jgi:hypothetical protein
MRSLRTKISNKVDWLKCHNMYNFGKHKHHDWKNENENMKYLIWNKANDEIDHVSLKFIKCIITMLNKFWISMIYITVFIAQASEKKILHRQPFFSSPKKTTTL